MQRADAGMAHADVACASVRPMSEVFAIFPAWFWIIVAVGVFDALLQWCDYLEWRRTQGESEETE